MKKIQIIILLVIASLLTGCNKKNNDIFCLAERVDLSNSVINTIIKSYDPTPPRSRDEDYLQEDINMINSDTPRTLYLLNIKNDYEIYCAYSIEDYGQSYKQLFTDGLREAYWFRWNNDMQIPSKIGIFKLMDIYIVYDAVVVEDVLNTEAINKNIIVVKRIYFYDEQMYTLQERDFINDNAYLFRGYKNENFDSGLISSTKLKYYNIVRNDADDNENILIDGVTVYNNGKVRDLHECRLSPYNNYFTNCLKLQDEFEVLYDDFTLDDYKVRYYAMRLDKYLEIIREIINEE